MVFRHFNDRSRPFTFLNPPALALMLALGACSTTGGPFSRSDEKPVDASAYSAGELDEQARKWSSRLAEDPRDKSAAISLSRLLRAQDKKPQAVVIMRQSAVHHPKDVNILGELGTALAAAGDFNGAEKTLGKAINAGAKDWKLYSTFGTVLDQQEKHEEARRYYARAVELEPDEPSVLSNMGLSYALDKNLPEAEKTLRRAVQQPGADRAVRENLALVLGLQGKFEEAERVASGALPEQQVAGNTNYLKQMMSQSSSWSRVQAADGGDAPTTN